MKNLKRLFSLILGICTLFTSIPNAFAGGINGEEILKDGTKIIFVSSDKIPEKLDYYEQKCQELLNKRYSTKQNLAIRSASLALAGAGVYLSSKLDKSHPVLAKCGKVVSGLVGLMGFFYPDYHERKYADQYGGVDGRPGYEFFYENKYSGEARCGAKGIKDSIEYFYNRKNDEYNESDYESGMVIVIRPKSKWNIINSFPSAIFSQKQFESDSIENGFSKTVLKRCIESGR